MQDFFYPDGFKDLVPDSFTCPYQGNTCTFNIKKYDTYYTIICDGCTEIYWLNGKYPANEKSCFSNWLLSKRLRYTRFSASINNWINGYRNTIYVKQIQNTADKSFTLKQSQTEKHTQVALRQGISFSLTLDRLIQKKQIITNKPKFNKEQLFILDRYLSKVPIVSRVSAMQP